MHDLIERLVHLWKTPSAFRGDWRRYAINVLGHAGLVGFLPGLLLGPGGLGLALGVYAMWEMSQWQFRRAEVSDCWEDWSFVACGAFFGLTGSLGYLVLLASFMVAGIAWRVEEQGP